MGPTGSPETSMLNQPTQCNIPQDGKIQERSEFSAFHSLARDILFVVLEFS
jgi:hypothetical protein